MYKCLSFSFGTGVFEAQGRDSALFFGER